MDKTIKFKEKTVFRKNVLKCFLIDLLKEHIRQMEEEEHITAFSTDDLKLAKKHLRKLRNSDVIRRKEIIDKTNEKYLNSDPENKKLFNYRLLRRDFYEARLNRDVMRHKYTGLREYEKEMGVSKSTLARFILKDITLDIETIIKICKWLNEPINKYIK